MKHRITLSTVAVTVTLLALGWAVSPVAQAQGRGRGRGQGAGGQGQAVPNITFAADPIAIRDPMRSAESDIVVRDDVQHELMLDGRQQQQIDDAITKGLQETIAKERAALQELRQKMQASGQNLRTMTQEDRQAAMQQVQQVQKQVQDAMGPIRDEQDKAVESALSKKQVARLHQLDLQWRTALALNVPKLADQVDFAPEQRQKVAAIYQEVTTTQQQAVQSIYGGSRGGRSNNPNANGSQADANNDGTQNNSNGQDNGGQSSQPGQPGQTNHPNLDPQAVQERLRQAQKTADKARKAGADKVLALLTPDQKAQWNSMIGAPFTFKENSPLATDNPNN